MVTRAVNITRIMSSTWSHQHHIFWFEISLRWFWWHIWVVTKTTTTGYTSKYETSDRTGPGLEIFKFRTRPVPSENLTPPDSRLGPKHFWKSWTEPHQDQQIFKNHGPNRTRTNQFLRILDRTGPGPINCWKYRTNSDRSILGPGLYVSFIQFSIGSITW